MVEIKRNKNVYAAFSNMAQHNFFMTLGNIYKKTGHNYDPSQNSADLILKDLKSKNGVVRAKTVDLLGKHFPFLAPMTDNLISTKKVNNTLDAYLFLLPKIVNVLNFYRNVTTHFDPDEEKEIYSLNLDERSLVPCMKDLFKASLRMVQQRFNYEEREMSFIKNKEMGKANFKYSLYKKELISNLDAKPNELFSLRGLLFFFSLFLEKKYINELLAKTKAFYTADDLNSSKRKKIIFEALSVYRVKLPKKRYDSRQNITALALDMVTELQRCPRELFDLLSPEDQELFRSEERNENDMNTMLMLRHSDRFATLAMRYIDALEVFKQIRFQINLGKYRFAFYEKKCIDSHDTEKQVRSLEKELHGFGRLHEIEEDRRVKWSELIRSFYEVKEDTATSTPYITDHYASYLINNNKIGLYWKAGKDDSFPGLPKLCESPLSKNLLERRKNGEKVAELTTPKCFLSTHELTSLIFLHLLMKDLDKSTIEMLLVSDVEKTIKDWTNGFITFVRKVLEGEIDCNNAEKMAKELGLDYPKQFPKKLLEYVEKRERDKLLNKKKLTARLHEHILETQTLIKKINDNIQSTADKRNRRGTKKFVEIKPGRLGAWLAHDIIALQPTPKDGNKLTGLNFQILQSALSVYDGIDNIKRILVGAHLIMHDDAHPFLLNVVDDSPKDTVSFYKKYLEEKLDWLNGISMDSLTSIPFLTRGVDKWSERNDDYYHRVLKRYLNMPVELPRGLFSEHIKKILAHRFGERFVKGTRRDDANVALLIIKYLKEHLKDDSQEFYTQPQGSYKRYYSFFKALFFDKTHNIDYGKTISQIEEFLDEDCSLGLLIKKPANTEVQNIDMETLHRAKDEIEKKLAKALAKNPSLDKTQRIVDIIKSSNKLKNLSTAKQTQLLAIMNVGDKTLGTTYVKNHLEKLETKERDSEIENLARALHKMKATERSIRRYKVEDVIIFLMARDILFACDDELSGSHFNEFKLKNIRPIRRQDGVGALEIMVPFSITLHIKGSNVPVTIRQEAIKLKNYGDFMRFLYDSRIETLIPYLIDDNNAVSVNITRDQLEDELSKYDRERHEVFDSVHKIEQLILERHRELRDKNSPNYYYDDKGKQKPVRGNFSRLLEYAQCLDDEESAETVNIRNAFAHNSYKGEGFDKVRITTNTIGEIAPAIGENIENKIENLKNSK